MYASTFFLTCGIPYLIPTPTLGSALTTFFTVVWSEKANMIEAGKREREKENVSNVRASISLFRTSDNIIRRRVTSSICREGGKGERE